MLAPKLRFPEFTDEWQVKKLGELGPVLMCKRIFKDQTHQDGDVPFYKIGTFGKEPDAFISRDLYEEYKAKYPFPRKGDILISASGTIGRLVVYDGKPSYFQDSNIIWLGNDESIVSNKFLYYCYKRMKWVTEDTTIARLYNDNLKRITISIPSMREQQKNTGFLMAVDDRIELQEKRVELLKKYKKGVMQKIFTQKIRFKDEDGKDYHNWIKKALADIAYSETSPLSANEIEGKTGQYKVYGASGVLQTLNRYQYNEEYIAIVKDGAGVGRISLCEPKSSVLGTMIVVQPKKGNAKKFLYYLLQLIDFRKYITGSTIPHVYFSQYSKQEFFVPGIEEQQKIANFLSSLDDKIELENKKLEQAKQFKKSLLQKMFV